MEIIFLFVSAVSNAMSAWADTLTCWGYGPKTAPIASGASQTQSASDMPGRSVAINAERIIINGPIFITNSPNVDEAQPIREANPADDPARDETK
ncbi:hypothetical protein [Actinotignum sp. GS-2025c]|uniref:hypothetical protein n=1 Tax=Actinotignum sp. GS-2025c TaxID=3427276 RepID=UPI003F44B458